jgi:type VI secretion system protein VasJ
MQSMEMDDSILQLGVNPISSDAPAGVSVKYEEVFEELHAEVAKLESLKDESVDWTRVVDLGTTILSSISKDLLVACYLCHGLYVTKDYPGLAAGLTILRDMVNTFWDELYPEKKRMRARTSAIKWMVDRLAVGVLDNKPALARHQAVKSSYELAEELERLVDEKQGDQRPQGEQEPHWSELKRFLRESDESLSREKKKLEQDPPAPVWSEPPAQEGPSDEAKTAVSVPAGPATTATPASPQEIGSEQDADRTLRACKDMLKKIASFRRERKLDDPQHYHLLRMAVWVDVELPMTQNGTTQVRQPADEQVENLNYLLESGEYLALIRQAESRLSVAPFWLSLHRYVATALDALGYADALRVVIADLSVLLQRFPTLPECKFVGGQTFADDLTQDWIQTAVLTGNMSHDLATMISHNTSDVSESADRHETGRQAKTLAAKGEFRQAVNLLKEGRKHAGTAREEFLWGLQEARFWQETGHLEIAVPQIELLDEEVERNNLEHWEPELSFQIAELLLIWYERMESKGSLSQERVARKERMRSRVSRLDAIRAMDIFTKSK